MTARRKAPCPGCLRDVGVRTKSQSIAGAGGKHRAPHHCPHGKPCVFGSRYANNGLNPGNMRHVLACAECAAARTPHVETAPPRTLEQLRRVRIRDMTNDERRLVFREAAEKLKAEIEGNRPAIERIFNDED